MGKRDNELVRVVEEYRNRLLETMREAADEGKSFNMEFLDFVPPALMKVDSFEEERKAIVYAALSYPIPNRYGALDIGDNYLRYYPFAPFCWPISKWRATGLSTWPLEKITNVRISRFLIWSTLTFCYNGYDGQKHKLKFLITSFNLTLRLQKQRGNVEILLAHLRERVLRE